MQEQEIIEGNKLIAEFMGGKYIQEYDEWNFHLTDFGYKIGNGEEKALKFNSSWDWLMPVVEKIEQTKPFYSVSNEAKFWYDDETDTVDKSRLQYVTIISDSMYRILINSANYYPERSDKKIATWVAVVEFIKWYNKK